MKMYLAKDKEKITKNEKAEQPSFAFLIVLQSRQKTISFNM